MYNDGGYTTPEGFWLARPLLLPEVRSFTDLLTYVRPWDHRTMTHRNGKVPEPELVPAPAMIGRNEIGPFCVVQRGSQRHSIAVTPTALTVDTIAPRIVTDDDRLSFEVIYHKRSDRFLVLAGHNYIIGSHWLAYVEPSSVPFGDES